jgi:hypothetical protein
MNRPTFAALPVEVLTSKNLSPNAKLLYAFFSYASGKPARNNPSWYSNSALAKIMTVGVSTVKRLKHELENHGLITMSNSGRTQAVALTGIDDDITARIIPSSNNGAKAVLERGLDMMESSSEMDYVETDMVQKRALRQLKNESPLYMNHKIEPYNTHSDVDGPTSECRNLLPPGDRDKEPGKAPRESVMDSMDRTSGILRSLPKKEPNRAEKRLELSDRAARRTHPSRWGSKKMVEYFFALCASYGVESQEASPSGGSVPHAGLCRHMRSTMDQYAREGMDTAGLADLMKWVISGWDKGLGDSIRPGKRLSILTFRYSMNKILDVHKFQAVRGSVAAPDSTGDTTREYGKDWFDKLDTEDK